MRTRGYGVANVESTPLGHAPRHEAANRYALIAVERPHHGAPCPVGLRNHGLIRHIDPDPVFGTRKLWHAHPIVTVFGFPVCVLHHVAVGKGAAETLAARQMLKPIVKRRGRVASIQSAPEYG